MGHIVSKAEVKSARVVDVDANHHGAGYHPHSLVVISEFLASGSEL